MDQGCRGGWSKLDAKNMTVSSEFVDVKVDVLNIIPPHKVGRIAFDAALVCNEGNNFEKGWCKVEPMTMASAMDPNVYTIVTPAWPA